MMGATCRQLFMSLIRKDTKSWIVENVSQLSNLVAHFSAACCVMLMHSGALSPYLLDTKWCTLTVPGYCRGLKLGLGKG